jgi:hypothetical protein
VHRIVHDPARRVDFTVVYMEERERGEQRDARR